MTNESETSLAGRRILVVEDMALVAQEIENILNRLDCHVVGPIGRLEKALDLVREESVDGVILDVDLHGKESYPLADVLQSRGIPFVFTTGYGSGSMPPRYHDHPRLEKPFGFNDLAQVMSQMFSSD